MIWVAIMVVCNGPSAIDCRPVAPKHSYQTEAECMKSLDIGAKYFYSRGLLATGMCQQIEVKLT